MRRLIPSILVLLALVAPRVTPAADSPQRLDARMLRYPDVSATQIAFSYAGDIWLVPKAGGEAMRISSPRGEEQFPKFSPDGRELAFSGNYDGNLDLYVMPVAGGVPRRVTHNGAPDRLVGWYPDGQSLLFATTMTSYKDRFNQLYKVSAAGGLPEKLPMPYGEFGALSPDGTRLALLGRDLLLAETTGTILQTLVPSESVGEDPIDVQFSHDGSQVYYSTSLGDGALYCRVAADGWQNCAGKYGRSLFY